MSLTFSHLIVEEFCCGHQMPTKKPDLHVKKHYCNYNQQNHDFKMYVHPYIIHYLILH